MSAGTKLRWIFSPPRRISKKLNHRDAGMLEPDSVGTMLRDAGIPRSNLINHTTVPATHIFIAFGVF